MTAIAFAEIAPFRARGRNLFLKVAAAQSSTVAAASAACDL
jgi:hypothetical protein